MITSMTGFGIADGTVGAQRVSVEIRANQIGRAHV